MRILAQSMGARTISSVKRFTSAASFWDVAPGNHAGMKARIGKILIKVAPGNTKRTAILVLLSALITQGSSTDSTSYPYIVFIRIETDNLRCDCQKAGRTISQSMLHTSYCGIQISPGS